MKSRQDEGGSGPVTLARKGVLVFRKRFSDDAVQVLETFASVPDGRFLQICLVGAIVIVITLTGFLFLPHAATANAAPEPDAPLDCLSCHVRVLKAHDKLGSGSEACWACHSNVEMGMLHLASGEVQFPLVEFSQLCAQCHQNRYQAWVDGTHGVPAWNEGGIEVPGVERVGCTGCHDPHQPQIVFSNITKPHPPPQPSPSPPSVFLLVLLGGSALLIVAVGVAVVTKGERP